MRCYICDYCDMSETSEPSSGGKGDSRVKLDKWGKPICFTCETETWKYWNYLGNEGVSDVGANIAKQVNELERRIPQLFQGPCCPNDGSCSCTFKSGCKALDKSSR